MAIHYRDPKTGEYEVIKIPVMKGDQGHAGIHVGADVPPTTDIKLWFDPSDTDNDVDLANRLETTLTACYDYMGNDRGSIKDAADANVEYILGEVNTAHYEGQRITATDTYQKQVKSAILKGQTLVNLATITEGTFATGSSASRFLKFPLKYQLTNGKKYIVKLKTKDSTLPNGFSVRFMSSITNERTGTFNLNIPYLVAKDSMDCLELFTVNSTDGANGYTATVYEIMVIEYQDGMENWDIPYFEGMKSVQMPVLKMTGKNLFDFKRFREEKNRINTGGAYSSFELKLEANTQYSFNRFTKDGYGSNCYFAFNTVQGSYTGNLAWLVHSDNQNINCQQGKFITDSTGIVYISGIFTNENLNKTFELIQNLILIEGSTIPTSYEPYKSNILSIDGEYRGIGDVCDTVDLITGEKVERIGEVVLDGSEDWRRSNVYKGFRQFYLLRSENSHLNLKINSKLINDKYVYSADQKEENFITGGNNWILQISKNENLTLEEFKDELKNNNVTVQYELATPVIKTVDLNNQKVYSYDGTTHYTCSAAEGSLVPTLSIDVPTNLPALVSRQRQQIEILEKENQVLSNELELAITSSEQNDGELLAQSFELDFRLMEVESALNLPMAATFQLGGKAMAMTPYDMAKKLILAGNYKRSDMERKLNVYVSKKRMTEVERQELIQLMNEAEGVITVEPEAEEFVTEHEAVTIPLH